MASLIHLDSVNGVIGVRAEHVSQNQQVSVCLENRNFFRSKCKIPIKYTYYDTENFSDEFKTEESIAYNYSLNGMNFESKFPLQPDSPVYIKIKEIDLSIPSFEAYGGHHAEVKWCDKQNNEFGTYYLIGVQFYEPLTLSVESAN